MAAGDSIVSICNIALIALGEDIIGSVFPPDNNKRARLCNQRYDDVRRAVLEAHPWNCAKRRASLPAISTPPAFGRGFAYAMPSNFLRIIDLPGIDKPDFEMEGDDTYGDVLLCDYGAPLNISFVCDLKDPTKFSPTLVHAIAYELASEIGMPLVQNLQKVNQMLGVMEGKLSIARVTSAQQGGIVEYDADVLLGSRG